MLMKLTSLRKNRDMGTFTKEDGHVAIGQVWMGLDKRMKGRKRLVVAIDGDKAVMAHPTMPSAPNVRVAIRRMHKGSTGWALPPKSDD